MFENIRCVVPAGDICGEGAVWHPDQNVLYWTDINRFLVHRFDPATLAMHTWLFSEPVTAVNLTTDSELLLLVMGYRVALWSPRTHPELQTMCLLEGAPEMRFNDAAVDPRGSLWAGTMRNNVGSQGEAQDVEYEGGVLYRIDPDGTVTERRTGVGISNTLAWSPDRKTFYFGDSDANAIYSFDYDISTGNISVESTLLASYPEGLPDGSAIDAEGFLWNARYGGRRVIRIAPNGKVDREITVPALNPTTCAFGGPDRKTLYVTSARSADQLSGSVFSMSVEVSGLPDYRFELQPA